MLNILVLPDAHVKPEIPLDRFDYLGDYIIDKKPEIIVCIGDFGDLGSMSAYDVGKKSFEGRRFKKDCEAVIEAQKRLFAPLNEYNAKQKKNCHKLYKPRLIMTLGNHEYRIERAVNNDAKLEGMLSVRDLKYEEFGWEVYPYKEMVYIENIAFCHYFPNGLMDRPIAGVNPANSILSRYHMSAVSGHSHLLGLATQNIATGKRITSIIAGCFLDLNQTEDYVSKFVQTMWYRGIVWLARVQDGEFDPSVISLEYLKERYEKKQAKLIVGVENV